LKTTRRIALGLIVVLAVFASQASDHQVAEVRAASAPAPCTSAGPGTRPPVGPTTITTLEQAYYCIFDHYGGSTLDDRVLLAGAFAGRTQALGRHGMDVADATLPALSGDRDSDWSAFSAVYQNVIDQTPSDPTLRQALARATMTGMVSSLHDNHAGWQRPVLPPGYAPGDTYGLGFDTNPAEGLFRLAQAEALPPLYVTRVLGGPAAAQGLRPGDVIVAINGAPPFVDGVPLMGAIDLLFQLYPQNESVRVTLNRPSTGRTWTVTMKPQVFQLPPGNGVTSKLVGGDVAYVSLPSFPQTTGSLVAQAVSGLGKGTKLHGVILNLRGNGGGTPEGVAGLLGAFVHGKVWSYDCDAAATCTPNHTDDSVCLLNLPLVVLTDRDCMSACDAFSGAVKDLGLGPLVGTRTSGISAGPADLYNLDDNSQLLLPSEHEVGADHEIINGIGVAPDHYLPLTAEDVSIPRDPDVTEALSLLGR
jgi:carboxyl-terminal processing protease